MVQGQPGHAVCRQTKLLFAVLGLEMISPRPGAALPYMQDRAFRSDFDAAIVYADDVGIDYHLDAELEFRRCSEEAAIIKRCARAQTLLPIALPVI
ncbi:hypothetical protein BST63_27655 [Bradyrhizobium canariense]|uniref:Uncharacterized protein n=1 Tax=Bradyrhizobium canariense TaxID=255045 RepID=A0ABX3WXL8_9BRAD|nr:hypothetical protein [Bradyrhizobium canariense]OSJ24306.1 hypothetical protein BST63_27655 [Bradyrhizobium canariense]